ncbi:hypothetical protein FNV43_RR03168 [Rhamnella rubrinervis]|uniref:Uncharacterized protein n=1 Tax=Rhamnella rubrinervis TaxID=2594499 RepID=A0A8K0MPC3_9ROSA|nr:hypothetical protein FNV43_RR03168 [Rhamnella rubrinervis]
MARVLSKTALLRHSLSSRLLGGPISLLRTNRARSTLSGEPQLIEVDLDSTSSSSSSSSDGESEAFMMRKLDDLVQMIVVQKSTPDWLPFVPGSSFWVPPRLKPVKFVDLIGKLADQLSEEECLSLATERGWPCSNFFFDGSSAAENGEGEVVEIECHGLLSYALLCLFARLLIISRREEVDLYLKECLLMAEQPETVSSSSQPSSSLKSSEDALKHPQVPAFSGFTAFPNGDFQMFPIMYPTLVAPSQSQEHTNRGAGIYAVPVYPSMGPIAGVPPNTLIPLTYNIPTRPTPEAGASGEEHGQEGLQQHRQQQQPAPQRQIVVRRFQIAFQLDLLLILKLAAVIFLFNQDGSRQRLIVLVFFASLVYLYQTGALTPLIRWLSQGMHRAAVPPQPRPAVRAENVPPARQGIENAAFPEGQPGAEIENRPAVDGNRAVENENAPEGDGRNGANHWWGIVKEIQMIVFGFITSLLPGFHNID